MAVSFKTDVVPMFQPKDIACMAPFGVKLDDYGYMSDPAAGDGFPDHGNARQVYARLNGDETPQMPMGGPYWTPQMLATYQQWMTDGFQP